MWLPKGNKQNNDPSHSAKGARIHGPLGATTRKRTRGQGCATRAHEPKCDPDLTPVPSHAVLGAQHPPKVGCTNTQLRVNSLCPVDPRCQHFLCINQLRSWKPSVFFGTVTDPTNAVLAPASRPTFLDDPFHFEFRFILVGHYGRGWHGTIATTFHVWLQPCHVDHGVQLHVWGKGEAIRKFPDPFRDGVRTNPLGVEFSGPLQP